MALVARALGLLPPPSCPPKSEEKEQVRKRQREIRADLARLHAETRAMREER